MQFNVFLVEDNPELREELCEGLALFGFMNVTGFASAGELYRSLHNGRRCDIAIVDIGLPGEDGFSLTSRLRDSGDMGIVILSAHGQLQDRLRGLQSGADVYLVKPVDLRELAATLQGLCRRLRTPARPTAQAAVPRPDAPSGWQLADAGWTLVSPDQQRLELTASEQPFVAALMAKTPLAVSRDDLVRAVGGDPYEFNPHRIDMLVNRLRRRASDMGLQLPLRSLRGKGYAFVTQPATSPATTSVALD